MIFKAKVYQVFVVYQEYENSIKLVIINISNVQKDIHTFHIPLYHRQIFIATKPSFLYNCKESSS